MSSNYVAYHVHSDYSLLDSCTQFSDYIKLAKDCGMKAIASTEHGKPLGWVSKKFACDEAGIKFIHGVEIYLTESLEEPRVRDNYHTILLAKNLDGVHELNRLVGLSCTESHFYYSNRITFDEFLSISDNIIKISACLASPLNKLNDEHAMYTRLARHYDYYEIQPHDCDDQRTYNQRLMFLSQETGIPLIAGTDTHNASKYKAECRALLLKRKGKSYGDEDAFDLTWKNYDELVDAFKKQGALPESVYLEAIENTNVMADTVEEFEVDKSIKYPILYGSRENDAKVFTETVWRKFKEKVDSGIIPERQVEAFKSAINEEMQIFEKLHMMGFMLSMSELVSWCKDNGMAIGTARGSVGGSRVAYVSDIIDMNPEQWHTVFSRFANAERMEIGDIDIDCVDTDRPAIFEHIVEKFGASHTARVGSYGTIADLGFIDDAGGGLKKRWEESHPDERECDNPWSISNVADIKKQFTDNPDKAKRDYPELFYYYDGMVNTKVSQSVHPAGMVISPLNLDEEYGVFDKDGDRCLVLDMEEIHDVGGAKYDFLVLSTVKTIRDAYKMLGKPYPRTHEIDWNDERVWRSMIECPIGIFQFEESFAHSCLKQFNTHSIFDMSLVTAAIRPSGASYRNDLLSRIPHHNPSALIDDLLKDNNGYLVYQEDIIKFLQMICGLTGSEADNVRRGIARKKPEILEKAMPRIIDGYCKSSNKPKDIAEEEVKEFIQIIEDASSYMFGFNHSVAYCLLGYICAWLRCYHPLEFIAASLNTFGSNQEKTAAFMDYAHSHHIRVMPVRFGHSGADYTVDTESNTIYKGISTIKYMNADVASAMKSVSECNPKTFMDVLRLVKKTSVNTKQIDILIKLDFFNEFGNANELSVIYGRFDYLKGGDMKTIKVDKAIADGVEVLISKHATNTNDKGKILKTYTITDMDGLMTEMEDDVRGLHLRDFDFQTKANQQNEMLGYVDIVTGNESDRRKLLITDLYPLKSKKTNSVWGYAAFTRSVGSGKSARLTVRSQTYNTEQFKKGDIVLAKNVSKDKMGYWYLNEFEICIE